MNDFYIKNAVEAFRCTDNNVIHAKDAVIEEIFHDNRSSFVTISYGVHAGFGLINIEIVTLVVDRNTVIRNRRGNRIGVRDLNPGDIVDASFSAAMTRSIPPQSRAFTITVVRENANPLPVFPNPNDMMSQIRFVVSDTTEIYDRRGNRIRLRDLRPGQMVRVEHADFMTASIPPQTTAFRIWVI